MKGLIEFINVCAWCNTYTLLVEELGKKYNDKLDIKIYKAGKDFEYIKKYGMFNKSVLIVNETRIIDDINKTSIEQIFKEVADGINWFFTEPTWVILEHIKWGICLAYNKLFTSWFFTWTIKTRKISKGFGQYKIKFFN